MKSVFVMLMIPFCCVAKAYTQQEELDVVRTMMRGVQRLWRDVVVLADDTNSWRRVETDYESLFRSFPTNHYGATWTLQERRTAFENFIEAIPELSTNGMYRGVALDGAIALHYCVEHSRSNVLTDAIRVLRTPQSECHSAAIDVFVKFARPSSAINAFVSDVLTNAVQTDEQTRSDIMNGYAEVLREQRDGCSPADVTNGIALVVGAVSGKEGVVLVDRLLLDVFPDYEMSSNRLAFAVAALADAEHTNYMHSLFQEYFGPVTNQLLNASGPLLRLDLP